MIEFGFNRVFYMTDFAFIFDRFFLNIQINAAQKKKRRRD